MESGDNFRGESERVKVSDDKKTVKKIEKQSETVQLVLLRNLKLNYTGPVSGKKYFFPAAGAVVPVNIEDAEIMLDKHGGTCCEGSGSTKPQPYFAEV
jgi:hypothetical protein